jgi:tripartite-type tricarboxylate transporter receptor subunit TctC
LNTPKRLSFWVDLFAIALSASPCVGLAQAYPSKPIRVIVSNPAGTGQDVELRQLVRSMAAELGATIIVENRPGGGQMLGMELLAKATPDGYTIGGGSTNNLAAHPRLYDRPSFHVERDVVPISLFIRHPWVLYVNAAVPARSFQEFVALAKAKPESITFATSGVGTFGHITLTLFQTLTGVQLRHVPYGAQPWQPDLVGGHINSSMSALIPLIEHVKSGRLRALAISNGNERSPQIPEVPLFRELGLPQFDPIAWAGLVAPAATPRPIIEQLSSTTARAAKSAQFSELVQRVGATAVGSTAQEFDTLLKMERARWKRVIIDNGIRLD